jgi:dienelactone hydrolase
MKRSRILAALVCSVIAASGAGKIKDLNTPRTFPQIQSKSAWQSRAAEIRENVLVSCGLWPMPEKTSLNAHVFGRVERDGYSIEKVYFETYPGFILAGNLYRPLGKGKGPFPAVLNPHGHWEDGRMADTSTGSIPARCISFARMGMVAFSYDMVGYNDSREFCNHRAFALDPTNQLWNISLMGLQTWNSIRALDFLESLKDVDRNRLSCTGESGGGTQTYMLGAVDDRLALQAPIVMVSHSMQGGCLCENAPGLRVDYSNMEIAAVPAPRPQMLVGATGDWTKMTMQIEGPALESIYRLFHARDNLRYVVFNFNHNYNQTSREAVYAWFDRWLLGAKDAPSRSEPPYKKEPTEELLVFPDGKLPEGALRAPELIKELVRMDREQLKALQPRDRKTLAGWKRTMMPLWRHSLQLHPHPEVAASGDSQGEQISISKADGSKIPARILGGKDAKIVAVLISPEGINGACDSSGKPRGLASKLVSKGVPVVAFDAFLTGSRLDEESLKARDQFKDFFTTYNRTDAQERVSDIQAVCDYVRRRHKDSKLVLVGQGRAGVWAVLAAPLADAVVADCDEIDTESDQAILDRNLFFPGYHRVGGLQGIAALAAPHPLLLHDADEKMELNWLEPLYTSLRADSHLKLAHTRLSDKAIVEWIGAQRL